MRLVRKHNGLWHPSGDIRNALNNGSLRTVLKYVVSYTNDGSKPEQPQARILPLTPKPRAKGEEVRRRAGAREQAIQRDTRRAADSQTW